METTFEHKGCGKPKQADVLLRPQVLLEIQGWPGSPCFCQRQPMAWTWLNLFVWCDFSFLLPFQRRLDEGRSGTEMTQLETERVGTLASCLQIPPSDCGGESDKGKGVKSTWVWSVKVDFLVFSDVLVFRVDFYQSWGQREEATSPEQGCFTLQGIGDQVIGFVFFYLLSHSIC